jgi:hypothetical protein
VVTLWFFGDSIFAGACFDVKVKPRHAMWPVRAPGPMIDLMLGEACTELAGKTEIPWAVDAAAAHIAAMVGPRIRPSDVIVMLDVGLHSMNPDLHERQWLTLRAGAGAHPGLTLICEGFEFGAGGRKKHTHSKPIGDGRSPNDAVRAAATQPMNEAGRTAFVPVFKPLLRYHHAAAGIYAPGAFWQDGVHLNVWGQGRLCWLILDAIGRAEADARLRWRGFAETHWTALAAPDQGTAARLADMACEPSGALYGAGGGAKGGGAR